MNRSYDSITIVLLIIFCVSLRVWSSQSCWWPDATWTERTSAGSREWSSLTLSDNGMNMASTVYEGYIYTSTDGGATWTERTSAGSREWVSLVSSADGMNLAAVSITYPWGIFTSTDGGATWTERTGVLSVRGIASSADGMKLAAIGASVYTSTDGGATWTERAPAQSYEFEGIASSADGMNLVVIDGGVYTSTDGGATWTERTVAFTENRGTFFLIERSIKSSADGMNLAIVGYDDYWTGIYTSTDGGATWTERIAGIPAEARHSVYLASSSDGMSLAAAYNLYPYGGYIVTSTDGGATWTNVTSAGKRSWGNAIAFSANGLILAAFPYFDNIHVSNCSSVDPSVAGPPYPFTCSEVQADGAICLTYPLSGFCNAPSAPYSLLPQPSACTHASNTGDLEIQSTEIHYNFTTRKFFGAVTVRHHLDRNETLFLTAKVFNSRTHEPNEKFRLGKGQFPLYKFNVSPSCPSQLVLKFDGIIPTEYNFDNADSFRLKIKKGKKNSLACANFYQLPLFEQK